jgi:hypothetical protein
MRLDKNTCPDGEFSIPTSVCTHNVYFMSPGEMSNEPGLLHLYPQFDSLLLTD